MPAVGDLLVAGVEIANNSLAQVNDPGWTRIQTPGGPTAGELLVVEYRYFTTADSDTFTWTFTNTTPWAVTIQDLKCTATTSPIDASSSTYFGSSTGGTTGSIVGHANDLPVAVFGIWMGSETDTPRSTWTEKMFVTETPWASISLQNNAPLAGSGSGTQGGDTWSAAGPNSGAVLLVKPLVMPTMKRVATDAYVEYQPTPMPAQICPWTTIAQDSNAGDEQDLDRAGCIAQLYTNPTRQAANDPNCNNNQPPGCPESIFAHNEKYHKLEKDTTGVHLLALGGTPTCPGQTQNNNNAQGATIAQMENYYLATRSTNLETPFFDSPVPFGLHPDPTGGTSFPCGFTDNAEWYAQYLSMINAVSIPGIINGAACSDPSDCPDQTIDGVMYLLSSPNVVGIEKEDCMNQWYSTSPPTLTTWQETVSTAIKVRTGGTTYFGGMFPPGKFYVCRGTTVSGVSAGDPRIIAVRQWALATFWLTYDESTGTIGPETGVPHSIYSTPWTTADNFTVLPEAGFVCTGPVKPDGNVNSFADLAVQNGGSNTGAYAREWNSCSLWAGPSSSQTSDGPCAAISVPGTSDVTWSSILPGLQNGLRYTKSLVLTGEDPLGGGTAQFTGPIPSVVQHSSGVMVCQS